jgi:hypothetical protein
MKLNIINMKLEVTFKYMHWITNRDRQVCIILPALQQYCVVSGNVKPLHERRGETVIKGNTAPSQESGVEKCCACEGGGRLFTFHCRNSHAGVSKLRLDKCASYYGYVVSKEKREFRTDNKSERSSNHAGINMFKVLFRNFSEAEKTNW